MELVNNFLKGLKAALPAEELAELNTAWGASKEDIDALKAKYPTCPQSLIALLEAIDGTYYREYGDVEVTVCILGSDVEEGQYPYYLLSTAEMLESSAEEEDLSYLLDDEDYEDDEEPIDPKIKLDGLQPGTYLHFSDCTNNGGSSRLYIDFNPAEKGTSGQIIRYLHDPDQYTVIADSFDDYLQNLIDNDFCYIYEDEDDDDE